MWNNKDLNLEETLHIILGFGPDQVTIRNVLQIRNNYFMTHSFLLHGKLFLSWDTIKNQPRLKNKAWKHPFKCKKNPLEQHGFQQSKNLVRKRGITAHTCKERQSTFALQKQRVWCAIPLWDYWTVRGQKYVVTFQTIGLTSKIISWILSPTTTTFWQN